MTIILSPCFHVHEIMLDHSSPQGIAVAAPVFQTLSRITMAESTVVPCAVMSVALLTVWLPLGTQRAFLSVLFHFFDEGWLVRVQPLGL